MSTVKRDVNSNEPEIAFSLSYHDSNLFERSKLWERLNRYREACQALNSKISGNHNDIGR